MARTFIRSSDLATGSIVASLLATDAVETAKIKDGAITSAKLGAGSVLSAAIGSAQVGTSALSSGAVTADKLGSASVGTSAIIDGAVTSAKLGAGSVLAAAIGAGEVGTAAIASGAITSGKIGTGAVLAAAIGSGAVGTAALSDGAVTSDKLGSASVTSAKLASASVGTSAIIDANVTTAKLASAAVSPDKADLTAEWTFSAGKLKTSMAATPADADVVTHAYLQSYARGVSWKESVRAAHFSAGAYDPLTVAPGTSFGGVTLAEGDRFLWGSSLGGATAAGVYVVGSSASFRAPDFDAPNEIKGSAVFVREGNSADTGFICTNDTVTIGTTGITFTQFTGLGQVTAGNGLTKTGNTMDVAVGNGVQILSDAVALKLNASNPGLNLDGNGLSAKVKANGGITLDANGLSISTANGVQVDGGGFVSVKLNASNPGLAADGAGLSVLLDGADAIESSGTGLKVKTGGISAAKLAANAVETAKINDGAVTYAKLAADVKAAIGKADHGMTFNATSGQTTFDLAHADANGAFGSMMVYLNGRLQLVGAGNDYTFSAGTGAAGVGQVIFTFALAADDFVAVVYGRTA